MALGGCGGGSSPAMLQSVSITPATASAAAGLSAQFSATAHYSDGSQTSVTTDSVWSSSNTSIASLGVATGTAQTESMGTVTVTAAYQGIAGSATLTVTSPTLSAIAVSPGTVSTPLGIPVSLMVLGTYSDHSTKDLTPEVTWASSSPGIASAAPSGMVTPLAVGQTTITATCSTASVCGSDMAAATLTVTPAALGSIAITGSVPSIATGQVESFTATGTYTDGSTKDLTPQVTWSLSSAAVGKINSSGIATAIGPGTATVTATLAGITGTTTLQVSYATLGLTWPAVTYEAEAGTLVGAAHIVGAPDGSDRTVGDLGGEASQRQAVLLTQPGDSVSWTVQVSESGANALIARFSIPDAAAGGGQSGSAALTITDPSGKTLASQPLQLTSRYSWLYGGVMDGTKLYNSPTDARQYATGSGPTHLYDEIQLKLPIALPAGSVITLAETSASAVSTIAIDFIDLEIVPPPIPLPNGFVSLTDARCGGIATDLRGSGAVFDGADDSSYGSVFNAVIGTNPHNPTSFLTHEKDYYSTNPATDALQDTTPNAVTANLSMFALADHNLASLSACVNLVASSNGALVGVYVPTGRFFVRGRLLLPNNVTLQGAGMWYSKFTAVDTAAPAAVTVNGVSGIASVSGNFSIGSAQTGANNVILSNFAIFGNVIQRDVVDSVIPDGVHAVYTNSILDNLWVEHMFSGLKLLGASSGDSMSRSRVRNTFADGIDFYGSTSNSTISNSSSRSTGDDGFAMWSQGTTLATTSQNDTVTNSFANLQWYGNGFAVYGGQGMTVTQSRAADILNYPCLQLSTYFVSPLLPTSVTATVSADHLDFYRCGGDGFDQQYGALLLVTDLQSLSSVALSDINIAQPAYKGLDFREQPLPSPPAVVATMQATLTNVELLGAPVCASVGADTGGSIALNNVCTCASVSSAPQSCPVNATPPNSLTVATPTCSLAVCVSF
jgi:hypothetical protein